MNNTEKIINIAEEVFHIRPSFITLKTTQEDIEEWDSLGQLSLITAIEQEFGITIEISEIFEIASVEDICKILERKGVV